MSRIFSALIAVLFFASAPAQAAPVEYEFDHTHTSIAFYVNHMGVSYSTGRFLDFTGGYALDEEKPESSAAEITINTKSIEMHNAKWNDHLRNPDFFNVEKFPTMSFKSTKIEPAVGGKTARMTGDLTLLGVTKPVTLDVTFNGSGKHPMKGTQMSGFSLTGTIKRSEFGMVYGLPMVGDDVELRIEVEGSAKAPANQ